MEAEFSGPGAGEFGFEVRRSAQGKPAQGFAVFARAGGTRGASARLESLRAWPLRPAGLDLSRFKV